jgi:hypothetical protein
MPSVVEGHIKYIDIIGIASASFLLLILSGLPPPPRSRIEMDLVKLAVFAAAAAAATFRTSTPQMGWNSYNYYSCSPTEAIIKESAQGLVSSGLAGLGYRYLTTDCGWMSKQRDGNGRLQWDSRLFPSGGKALGDFLHSLGLKFGVYSGGGYYQCGSKDLPASLGNQGYFAPVKQLVYMLTDV